MNVTKKTLEGLDEFLKEHLEADIVAILVQRLDVSSADALSLYYNSNLSEKINKGEYGIQYLAPEYLADELLKEIRKEVS